MLKQKIKVLIMDVDGTLTDGKIYMGESGEVMKAFDIKDGYGINHILPQFHIIPVVLTGRVSKIVENRCNELHISHLYQGVKDKKRKLKEIMMELSLELDEDLTLENLAYMGDDIIDLECMKICGISGCPADAVKEIIAVSDFISDKNGGCGAVREFIEWLVENKGK